jgi:hypothetical protein
MNEDIDKQEILKYYKRVVKCILCLKNYGSDYPYDNRICPPCDQKLMNSNEKEKKEDE